MTTRMARLRHDERGMSFVFLGTGFMAFFVATTLAIDVGMFMTARAQAQNSADAGALGGAYALAFDDFNDRSADGPAVQSAINTAMRNQVIWQNVSVLPADVTFPNDPAGQPTRIRVDVFRTGARGNPLATLVGQYFGVATANVGASATAEVSPANAISCVKPFIIPDKWIENQTGPWDETDTFEMYDNRGQMLPNPDQYIPADQPGYTGYTYAVDRGRQLVIRAGSGNNIVPTFYYSLSIGVGGDQVPGGLTGADAYRWNIANCNTTIMHWGDLVIQEPGNMVGPTVDGAQALMAQDPNAFWNTATNDVAGSAFNRSPRVFPIPLYDPVYYETGKQNGRYADLKVANYIGFFLERVQGNELVGRIIPILGILESGTPTPTSAFPLAIRLVE